MALTSLLILAQIALATPPALRPGLAAYPRIVRPRNAAERQINRRLASLDAQVLEAAMECRREAGERGGSWERRVETTMRGPDFLSFLVTSDTFCGGAHPNNSHQAIVYDLGTGKAVDWAALLPAPLVGKQALVIGDDGVATVTLASRRLGRLYAAGYAATLTDHGSRDACDGVGEMELERETGMTAWLDARRRAMMLQFDHNHAMQYCSRTVAVPLAQLQREGASPRLLRALGSAGR